MQIDSSLIVEPFGKIEAFSHPDGIRIVARIRMRPQVEGAQTGLAIDGSVSMQHLFGANLPPMFRKPEHNVMQVVAVSMAQMLADFDSDGETTVIYWATGLAGENIETLGDMNSSALEKFSFSGPKKFGTGTKLFPAMNYYTTERFANVPWSIFVFITDGVIEDLENVKARSLEIAAEMAAGNRGFTKFVLIGLGAEIDERQMEELDNLDYGGLKTPEGEKIDLWDSRNAADMTTLDTVFDECVGENSIISNSAVVTDSFGNPVMPLRRASYADGLPALIEFVCAPGSTGFTVNIPSVGTFNQPLI
jgi:hypothetical protein